MSSLATIMAGSAGACQTTRLVYLPSQAHFANPLYLFLLSGLTTPPKRHGSTTPTKADRLLMSRPATIAFSDFTYLNNHDISPFIQPWLNQHSIQSNQMRPADIDIGSRIIECVVLENGKIVFHCQTAMTFNPRALDAALLLADHV
jgi:hypothetical protein